MPDVVSIPATPAQRCAVIGHPAGHSLSPALHRAAYAALGLAWTYDAIDLSPEAVVGFLDALDPAVWRGLSVTMPHKQVVRQYGVGDDLVELVGVANTLVLDPSGDRSRNLVRNTDVPGFVRACRARGVEAVGRAVLVGNGATARSTLVGLTRLGCRRVAVMARRPDNSASLVELGRVLGVTVDSLALHAEVPPTDLVVSTVPAGGADHRVDDLVRSAGALFDAVYDPWPTPLAAAASAVGLPVVNGLDLLAGQAVDQVELMTGVVGGVTFELLRDAGLAELARRSGPPDVLGD